MLHRAAPLSPCSQPHVTCYNNRTKVWGGYLDDCCIERQLGEAVALRKRFAMISPND